MGKPLEYTEDSAGNAVIHTMGDGRRIFVDAAGTTQVEIAQPTSKKQAEIGFRNATNLCAEISQGNPLITVTVSQLIPIVFGAERFRKDFEVSVADKGLILDITANVLIFKDDPIRSPENFAKLLRHLMTK